MGEDNLKKEQLSLLQSLLLENITVQKNSIKIMSGD